MLLSKANWKFVETNELEDDLSITQQLLIRRGLDTKEAQQQFLNPALKDMQSPNDFNQMEIASERIMQAINEQEHIVIYGDYDADGITSTALLMTAFIELGALCDFYIPNRFDEGYGLHPTAIKKLADEGVSLIITVDTGITSVEAAAYAKEIGIDLIITDHHEAQEELPDAYAIIHPVQSPDYKFKSLAGVGVALQLAHKLLGAFPEHLLDFAAIGTIADLVPLVGENRIIAYHGLKQLAKTDNIGLKALKQMCKIEDVVTEKDIGFGIAPRLNAVGRLQNASLAVHLLLAEDEETATEIATEIEELNVERQQIVKKMVAEADKMVDETKHVIVLHNTDWHEGVLGIAASRLANKFDRPVIMLKHKADTGELKGSARSVPAFNLFENGMKIKHLFTNFGGHSQAAGMTFPFENLSEISELLNESFSEQLGEEPLKKEILINQKVTLPEVTEKLVETVQAFAPFGMGNSEPIFYIKEKPSNIRQIGNEKNHLKLQFKDNKRMIDAIGFKIGELYHYISKNAEVAIVGKLQINIWNGNKTVQMLIDDIAVDEWQLFDFRGRQNRIDLQPFVTHFVNNVIVTAMPENIPATISNLNNVEVISYDGDTTFDQVDMLYVYDFPDSFAAIEELVKKTQPRSIHISFGLTSNAYLENVPSREEFAWLYSYLVKNNPVQIKIDLAKIMRLKGWSKDRVIFMIQVFLDLEFVAVQDSIIHIKEQTEKTALETSTVYQRQLEQGELEKVLYYSTYEELKAWFMQRIDVVAANREEVQHDV